MKSFMVLAAGFAALVLSFTGGASADGPQFTTGTVNAVDTVTRTMVMGADTYYVRGATTNTLSAFKPGERVEITYVVEDGKRVAVDIRSIDRRL